MNTDRNGGLAGARGVRGEAEGVRGDGAALIWSAVTGHRFCAGDLSPSNFCARSITSARHRWREPWTGLLNSLNCLGSTATSRLAKAVTSHRTPNDMPRVDGAESRVWNRSPSPQPSPAGRGGRFGRGRWQENDPLFERRSQGLPLPAGEGWGEGEWVRRARPATIRQCGVRDEV